MTTEELKKEAAKFRKWPEKYTISPFAYILNEKAYHLVDYHGRNPENLKGIAVISLDGGPKSDYKKALYPLTQFASAVSNIFTVMGPRRKLTPKFYEDIIEAIETSSVPKDETLTKGIQLFEKLIEMQTDFNRLYDDFKAFYTESITVKNVFNKKDVDYTLSVLAKLDLMQFKQGHYLDENIKVMHDFLEKLSDRKIRKHLSRESKNFIRGMNINQYLLDSRLLQYEFEYSIINLPEKEQIERKKAAFNKEVRHLIKERENQLRGHAAM